MQNTFSLSGNDFKCFFKKNHCSEYVCGTRDSLPFMEKLKTILNFHFDYLTTSLSDVYRFWVTIRKKRSSKYQKQTRYTSEGKHCQPALGTTSFAQDFLSAFISELWKTYLSSTFAHRPYQELRRTQELRNNQFRLIQK